MHIQISYNLSLRNKFRENKNLSNFFISYLKLSLLISNCKRLNLLKTDTIVFIDEGHTIAKSSIKQIINRSNIASMNIFATKINMNE